MTIFQKLFASFSSLILIVIGLSFLSLIAFFEVARIYSVVSDDVLPEMNALTDLRENWLRKAFEEPRYQEGTAEKADEEWNIAESRIQESLAKLRAVGLRNPGIGHIVSEIHLQQIEEVNDRLNSHKDDLAAELLLGLHDSDAEKEEHYHSIHEHIEEGLIFLDDLKYALSIYTENANRELRERMLANMTRVLVSVPIAVIIALLLSLALTRSISRPILSIHRAAQRLKQGEFNNRITDIPKGELGELAATFNEMAAKLQNYYQNLEEKIQERTKALQDSEQKYRSLVDSAPAGVFRTDVSGEILYGNAYLAHLLGFKTAQELIGTVARDYYADEKQRDEFIRLLKRDGQTDYETELVSIKGKKHRVIISGSLENGALNGMIIDVTERREAEQDIRDLDQLKSRFITALTHVLRTPLSSIRWNIETVLSGDLKPVNTEQQLFLRRALESQHQILGLIGNMNTVLDIERKAISQDRAPISITSLALSVVDTLKARFAIKKTRFQATLPQKELPSVQADAKKIRAIMENLLDNAVRYTPAGGKVTLRITNTKETIRFSVSDTGVGIPKAEQKHIFERFFRASNAATTYTDGIGLSLHIAKYFVENYAGSIGFTSKEGQGSTFWFELPTTTTPVSTSRKKTKK